MRIEPVPPEQLDAEQRPVYDTLKKGIDGTQSFGTFTTARDDGALLGPFNAWVHQPAIGAATWTLTEAITAMKTLPPRVRQIVILVTGSRFNAAYEIYAHTAVALDAGLAPEIVSTLVAGERPAQLAANELLAYDASACLARGAILPQATYDALVAAFEVKGAAELIYLVGLYCLVSTTLNGFDVPVPGTR